MMTENSNRLLVVGLNPAWQKTLIFDRFTYGEVNRARQVTTSASGKGINCSQAIMNWGGTAQLFQFTGGDTGTKIEAELLRRRIDHISVTCPAPTRICTTCLCEQTGTMTELIEPSGTISEAEAESLLEQLEQAIPDAAGLALCGTFPPGVTTEFYAAAARTARAAGVTVILDAYKEIGPVLETGVDILKVNAMELMKITGSDDLATAIKQCLATYPLARLAITAGPKQAYLADSEATWNYTLPHLDDVRNPLGAGDTVTGVMLAECASNAPAEEAFALALAAASASCRSLTCADFAKEDALQLRSQIEITKTATNI